MTDGSPRTILHVDMDAFFVSVELLERPDLVRRPVVVGGDGRRGVVAAANYEARRFGVRSAMPTARARRACPDLVVLPGRHDLYVDVSRRIMRRFADITPLVEPISLDEAFLDVTGARRLFGTGEQIAHRLRAELHAAEGLWCSVGVASTKFVAKLASRHAKPRPTSGGTTDGPGVLSVADADVETFLRPLPASELWGVGPATQERLAAAGLVTVGDLADTPVAVLERLLGASAGRHLHLLSCGIDERDVVPHRKAKSVGHEQTYATDLVDVEDVDRELLRLSDALSARLASSGVGGTTLTLKVRFGDFTTVTRSATLAAPLVATAEITEVARDLLGRVDIVGGVRLLGLSASGLGAVTSGRQLTFDDAGSAGPSLRTDGGRSGPSGEVHETVEAIRRRWGVGAIGPARLVRRTRSGGTRLVPGKWGPTTEAPAPGGPGAGEPSTGAG